MGPREVLQRDRPGTLARAEQTRRGVMSQGIVLVVAGIWLIAQTLRGGLIDIVMGNG